MTIRHGILRLLTSLMLLGGSLAVAPADDAPLDPQADDVARVAGLIDEQLRLRWEAEGVAPVAPATDAEFLRRAYLDLAGRIPSLVEARTFLDDPTADKRARLVDELLDGPGYIVHFTRVWRSVLMPEADSTLEVRFLVPGFENWLRGQLLDDRPYDKLVYDLLTAPVNNRGMSTEGQPTAFFEAKETKPENLAAATSRMFLGLRLECAQCHDHPFDTWEQRQFWELAAFYSGLERTGGPGDFLQPVRELFSRPGLRIPDTKQTVTARYLDGTRPPAGGSVNRRALLARWVTSPENVYFRQMAANRVWAHFFGIGIVDPVDDFTELNPPSHPELLEQLSQELVASDFDLKFLIRAIMSSGGYQLSSATPPEGDLDPHLFARMPLRRLTSNQVYRSVACATGHFQQFNAAGEVYYAGQSPRGEFEDLFDGETSPALERQATVLQALTMMNGDFLASATSLQRSQTLAAIVDYPGFSQQERIETLYLAALSRRPEPDEAALALEYIERQTGPNGPRRGLADLFWALLNSSEFSFNH